MSFTNWRRILLLGKTSSVDVEQPASYVLIDWKKIPVKRARFCDSHWSSFGFDYDPFSYLLWPLDDKTSAQTLSDSLNKKYAGCACVILKAPVEAHNLVDREDELEF